MKRLFLLWSCWLFSLAGLAASWARVGETEAQCVVRYGEPLVELAPAAGRNEKAVKFHKSSLDILAIFERGRAVSITYTRKDAAGKTAPMSVEERLALLGKNGGKRKWSTLEPTQADDKYETADGVLRGRYNRNKKYLEVYESAWSKEDIKRKASAGGAPRTPPPQAFEGL